MKVSKSKSPYIIVRGSDIHNKGVFSKKNIPGGTRIIEYIGEKITKKESERRADLPLQKNKQNPEYGAVYIFELNKRYDIDGYVTYNTARYINHSCSPNCETQNIRGHIWIIAIKDIPRGGELTYNYGYDMENYEDHPCRCQSDNCMGYILAEEHWKKLKNRKLSLKS
ncbi:MAG: SET domain-containing protein-lysine N-methyltransferase [Candidatus Omnitrophica bacterium]|nr:SET domain-containing protein-lysine N-methyltransferase [Candidatus Omnitrophota bacterium]